MTTSVKGLFAVITTGAALVFVAAIVLDLI